MMGVGIIEMVNCFDGNFVIKLHYLIIEYINNLKVL